MFGHRHGGERIDSRGRDAIDDGGDERSRAGRSDGGARGAAVAGDVPRAGAGEGRERAVGGDDVERS